jgi:DNA-binding response OmpR family regulator
MRVLLVDDERELVATLAERLLLRGIDAMWALNGEEALELARREPFDVAVLDMKMPKISGLVLRRMLQAEFPGMGFIFLTGHGSEEDFAAGAEATGENFYLIKPVNIEQLVERIRQLAKG